MCILCNLIKKATGAFDCGDTPAPWNHSTDPRVEVASTSAGTLPGGVAAAVEISGTDTIPGSTATGIALSNATFARGTVNTAGDQDWYRITLTAGHTYTFAENGFGRGAIQDPFLRVFSATAV